MMKPRSFLASCLLLFAGGVLTGIPYFFNQSAEPRIKWPIPLVVGGGILAFSCRERAKPFSRLAILLVAMLAAVLLAYTVTAAWPNSGDEYSYLYLARTLLAGRVYNPAPPLAHVFDFYTIGVRDGKMASQYGPGWSVILAPFLFAHVAPLANPALLIVLAGLLWSCLGLLGTPLPARLSLLALVMLAPFTLFNGASYFNHILSAIEVLGICWCMLREEQRESAWNRAGVGALLASALATRPEVFAITAAVLALDVLVRLRLRAIRFVLPAALGGLPIGLGWLAYNASITGHPLVTTQYWAFPGSGFRRSTRPCRVSRGISASSASSAAAFFCCYMPRRFCAGCGLGLGGSTTFCSRQPSRFSCSILLNGGHQYGPRYWFAAWPTIVLTIGAVVADDGAFARLGPVRIHLPTLAAAQTAVSVGFSLCFAVFLHEYMEARRVVLTTPAPALPAVVLVPKRRIFLNAWQNRPYYSWPMDFARNDLDFTNPTLFGSSEKPEYVGRACRLAGRHVYLWEEPGDLREVDCAKIAANGLS